MENNILDSPSSISIWPSRASFANEIDIPIIIEHRPFEKNSQLIDLSQSCHHFPKCNYCKAFVTSVFVLSKERTASCPYCGSFYILPKDISFLPYQNFKTEKVIEHFTFYLCFVIDLDCSPEHLIQSKKYFSTALRALLPGTIFIVSFIKNQRFHFLMMFNNNTKIISLNVTNSLFNKLALKSFINSVKSIEAIDDFVQKNITSSNSEIPHEMIDFSPLFLRFPEGLFIKFLVFSPNHLSDKCSSRLSIDWISPVLNPKAKNIDGFYMNPEEIDNIDFQIQSMVQRYLTSSFAINLTTDVFLPPQFDISPSNSVKRPSVHSGSSILFTISFPNSSPINRGNELKEINVQFVSRYTIISPSSSSLRIDNTGCNSGMKATFRFQINSYSFQTSKDVLPILRSVNPVVLKKSFSFSKSKEKETIRKLLELYRKVVEALPGASNNPSFFDTYFLLLPNMQLLLNFFLATEKPAIIGYVTERELEYVQFCPVASMWVSQENKIEETPLPNIDSDEAFKAPPIVVIDSCAKIDVYMDEPDIDENSCLAIEIRNKVQSRFPVPMVLKHPRNSLFLNLKESNKRFVELVQSVFDPAFKNQ